MNYEAVETIKIENVVWDSSNMELTIYYEDQEALRQWKFENPRARKDKTPTFLKFMHYDLKNPNQALNVLFKVRKAIVNEEITGGKLYKEYKTFDKWFELLKDKEVPVNEYGYLA